jgi:hypothetical protein
VERVSWALRGFPTLPQGSASHPWAENSGVEMGVHVWNAACRRWLMRSLLAAEVAERPRSRLAIFRVSRRRAEQICMLRRQWWVNRCGDSEVGGSSAEQSHVLASKKGESSALSRPPSLGPNPDFSSWPEYHHWGLAPWRNPLSGHRPTSPGSVVNASHGVRSRRGFDMEPPSWTWTRRE